MSTRGVRNMWIDTVINNRQPDGKVVISENHFNAIRDYAKRGILTSGEIEALLNPTPYLSVNRALQSAGISVTDIVIAADARLSAEDFGQRHGAPVFPGFPLSGGTGANDPAAALAKATADFKAALAAGKDVGTFADWEVQLSASRIAFAVDVQGQKYPAMVVKDPDWKDPAPRSLLNENLAEFRTVKSPAELKTFVDGLLAKEQGYFEATGVQTDSNNEKYGIQNERRTAFFEAARSQMYLTSMPQAERAQGFNILRRAQESLFNNRAFDMEVGTQSNYWPYWEGFTGSLEKLLDQVPQEGSGEWLALNNRVWGLLRKKTVFGRNTSIDETNIERSMGGALVHLPQFSSGDGHRVSLTTSSTRFDPSYETLSVATSGLPDSLKQYAGAQVFRDTDSSKTLRFDVRDAKNSTRGGQAIAAELAAYITSKPVDVKELNVREPKPGENLRADMSFDWNESNAINIARIMIDWWGHCHNSAPLNDRGVEPKKPVARLVADLDVSADKAVGRFSVDDAWNITGAFADASDQGFFSPTAGQFSPNRTTFVGQRNNGGHWLKLEFDNGFNAVTLDAEVTELWHKSDPSQRYPNAMQRFRRDIENTDGTFSANPDWVASGSNDDHNIVVDAMQRRMGLKVKFRTFDGSGLPVEKEERIHLDPTKDQFVKLADDVVQFDRPAGGKLIEYWYNPKTAEYHTVSKEVRQADSFQPKETGRSTPVKVARLESKQETTYGSVQAIDDFVTKNMGYPFTFDTEPGMAVWNYGVKYLKRDELNYVEKVENGQTVNYTTYRMTYRTQNGPQGSTRFIIKRDEGGNFMRALALDPMPDFAYRQDRWVSAPVVADNQGRLAVNLKAYFGGYLTNKTTMDAMFMPRTEHIKTEMWRAKATVLWASLSGDTAKDKARIVEHDGKVFSFDNDQAFDRVAAAWHDVQRLHKNNSQSGNVA